MVEWSGRRREMKDMATTRMLLTTAVLAAVAALIASPAPAFVMDVEGGGGTGAATAAPAPQTIPYLSHGIGVDQTLFAGQQSVNPNDDSVLTRVDNKAASKADELDPAIRTAIAAHKAQGSSLGQSQQNGPIPYLSHGVGVDESQFSGLAQVQQTGPIPSSSSGTERDWTWIGLGAGLSAALAAVMAAFFFSARQRGRVALP
jgi:hypothetical protein